MASAAAPGCPAAAADVVLLADIRKRWENLRPTKRMLSEILADGRVVVFTTTTPPSDGRTAQYNAVPLLVAVVTRKRMDDQGRVRRVKPPAGAGLMARSKATLSILLVSYC